jgi:hypothetical protein
MFKNRLIIIVLAVVGCLALFSGCQKKIWAHRANSPEMANQKKRYFHGIEVDLVFDKATGELFVSHDIEGSNTKLTFRQYLQQVRKPGKINYWLDVKNLYENPCAICDTIMQLADYYKFTEKFFVESWDIEALKIAKTKGVSTSLWVENVYDSPQIDTLMWFGKVKRFVDYCNPDALSAEYRMRPFLNEFFPTIPINLWQTPAELNDENAEITREICRDPHVKVLLVDYDKPIKY